MIISQRSSWGNRGDFNEEFICGMGRAERNQKGWWSTLRLATARAVTSSGERSGGGDRKRLDNSRAVVSRRGSHPLGKQAGRTNTPTTGFSHLLITCQCYPCLNPSRSQEPRVCSMQPTQDTEQAGEGWGANPGQQRGKIPHSTQLAEARSWFFNKQVGS